MTSDTELEKKLTEAREATESAELKVGEAAGKSTDAALRKLEECRQAERALETTISVREKREAEERAKREDEAAREARANLYDWLAAFEDNLARLAETRVELASLEETIRTARANAPGRLAELLGRNATAWHGEKVQDENGEWYHRGTSEVPDLDFPLLRDSVFPPNPKDGESVELPRDVEPDNLRRLAERATELAQAEREGKDLAVNGPTFHAQLQAEHAEKRARNRAAEAEAEKQRKAERDARREAQLREARGLRPRSNVETHLALAEAQSQGRL